MPKKFLREFFGKKIKINKVYNWSYNRGYIYVFYETSLTKDIRGLVELTQFFYLYFYERIVSMEAKLIMQQLKEIFY